MGRAGENRSTGQPVATGAGAIPARPRTPDPIHGGMRGKEMNKDEYRKLLLHPSWQKKRLEILNRDGFACRICGDETSTLHVHHLHYVAGNAPWEYAEETLITLCDGCHEAEHASRRQYEQGLIEQLRLLGLMSDDVGTIKNTVERLRFELGQEGARHLFMSVLGAISWSFVRKEAVEELLDISDAFIDRQAKWLESER